MIVVYVMVVVTFSCYQILRTFLTQIMLNATYMQYPLSLLAGH